MRLNWTDFGRKWQMPWLIAFGSLPVGLIYCANMGGHWWNAAALAAMYGLLTTLCLPVRGRMRLAVGVVCAAAMLGMGTLLPQENGRFGATPISAMYAVLILLNLPVSGWERGRELPPAVGGVSLAVFIIAQILVNADDRQIYSEEVRTLLTLSFVFFLTLAMLWMNRSSLNCAANGRETVPVSMRRKNMLLTFGVVAAALLISAIPALVRAVEWIWDGLMACIGAVLRWLANLMAAEETVAGTDAGGSGGMLPAEAAEPGWLAILLQRVFMAVAIVVAAVAIAFALKVICRKLKVLMALLMRQMRRYLAASTEDYEDEVTDTREDGERTRILERRRRTSVPRMNERRMSPVERVRNRYRLLQARHAEWPYSSTARENLADETAAIYERARYSSHDVTCEDAERFAEHTRL